MLKKQMKKEYLETICSTTMQGLLSLLAIGCVDVHQCVTDEDCDGRCVNGKCNKDGAEDSDVDLHFDTGDTASSSEISDPNCYYGIEDTDGNRICGWTADFNVAHFQFLTTYDPNWIPIFGKIELHTDPCAAFGEPGTDDGNDDYAYRRGIDTPMGSVEITEDFYWDGSGTASVLVAVQDTIPHQFYDAAIYGGNLTIAYLLGPTSSDIEILASDLTKIYPGSYRIVVNAILTDGFWQISATLLDPNQDFATIAQIHVSDNRLGPGRQGIGIWKNEGVGCYITRIAVKPLR